MRITVLHLIAVTGIALFCLSGCGGDSGEPSSARVKDSVGEAETSGNEIRRHDIADLPPVDEPLQRPLDEGRLAICPPADWGFFPQANYLVVFAKGKVSELPRMTVAAIDSPYGSEDTTEDNAQALAKNIQQKLAKDKKNIREKPKPVILADRVWVRHVRQVSQGGSPCAVQSLQIVRDGRLYSLEMFSAAKDDSPASLAAAVGKDRDTAYTVAANAKFTKESGDTPAIPPAPTEEKPAEKTPPEAKPTVPPAEKPPEPKPTEKKTE
ncbi:MAG: hypothetical protein IAF94_20155 [Pirellulaceae bacterium]|nr:hypothetical protein [Pirellulaceae bacterium]